MKTLTPLIAVLVVSAAMSGCGNKGQLLMPSAMPAPAPVAVPVPDVATPADQPVADPAATPVAEPAADTPDTPR